MIGVVMASTTSVKTIQRHVLLAHARIEDLYQECEAVTSHPGPAAARALLKEQNATLVKLECTD